MEKQKEESSVQNELREKVIDAIAQTMDLYGVNYSFGKLYGIMFFEEKPLTLEEMKGYMNMSKSNMSYAVRSLVDSGMVTQLEEKKDRKNQYVAETDFFKTFRNFFTVKLQREIDVMLTAINEAITTLSEIVLSEETTEEERQACLKDLHKLKHSAKYYNWLQQFVELLRNNDLSLFDLKKIEKS
ncbi:winged helix DNA-binding protein [Siminovitchia sp. FSL H7-0308]|uniref:HTH-type transcriptional regulator n=1 Tax=Siminovitchia thermophila TaxID=1245522 RepID=A0ABS2RA94_9BACI|nr:winged helix DNA-binding protein [Siminovitchia thermophila]MBM7716571.1 DNA-binding transcriptional regulator GbsR (MarR family) [Siminovitchia thermophila]